MCDDPHLGQTKCPHQGRKILAVRISGSIRHSNGAHFVWKVVATAVGDCAITIGKFGQVLQPHPVVLKPSVNKYDRLTSTNFDIGQLSAIDRNALHFVCVACWSGCKNKERRNETKDGAEHDILLFGTSGSLYRL